MGGRQSQLPVAGRARPREGLDVTIWLPDEVLESSSVPWACPVVDPAGVASLCDDGSGVTIADGTPVGVAAGVARVLEVGEVMGEEPDAVAVGDAAGEEGLMDGDGVAAGCTDQEPTTWLPRARVRVLPAAVSSARSTVAVASPRASASTETSFFLPASSS